MTWDSNKKCASSNQPRFDWRTNVLLVLCFLIKVVVVVDGLFVFPPTTVEPYPGLRLAAADKLKIKYTGRAFNAGDSASLPSFALSLDAEFGTLSESDFTKLMKIYSGWSETKSRVVYDPDRTFYLMDFLPPLLQATNGCHFRSSRTPTRNLLPSFLGGPNDTVKRFSDQEVLLVYNCWGFAWEVLFQADNADVSAMTISTADPTSAWRAFTGPSFDLIQSSETKPALLKLDNIRERNKKIQPGDVLLIWHRNPSTASGTDLYLDHVATCIDEDVYFEKSGSGDNVPFRLATWEMITKNFPTFVFVWEWRRLVRNNPLSPNLYGNVQRLQPASDLFGINSQVAAAERYVPPTKRNIQSRFSLLGDLAKQDDLLKSLSLQADLGEGGVVESQVYTGILLLEDIQFNEKTGRAYLPKSAFTPSWYQNVQQSLLQSSYR
ncbi:hypothetical protein IV203_030614 [Nitzschia inconspicua]|uniref:Uncharacterized protein n=1 Tax=Nitzschia inconspicua TaxID=303405 RepID=A0A9K3PGW9_9STRA|nr:hypothetical protein IV203_015952 [Nitzschia inconspicua]KAG7367871.1 hypothetical protein IV203_030614 [Nitzschia inconspicua]